MFENIKDKINNKSIEFYVENQLSETKEPLEVNVTLRIFSVDILFYFTFLFLFSSPNFFTGIDRFGIFGVTYAELILNYLIILLVDNIWRFLSERTKISNKNNGKAIDK
ncbi:TPA: hypothetical protein ACJXXT_000244 [Pseudomonas aeruginosa]